MPLRLLLPLCRQRQSTLPRSNTGQKVQSGVGIVEKVMNDGSIGSTFNEGHMTVEGEDAFCVDINTNFRNGYKTRADASTRMSYEQISDVALSIEYVNQYVQSHSGLSKSAYLSFETVRRMAEIECSSGLAMR